MSESLQAVTIPKWGMDMAEGTIVSWAVEEGDTVDKGQTLVEIESAKIANEMESPAGGVLLRRLCEVDETLDVGELIAVLGPAGTADSAVDAFIAAFVPADTAMGAEGAEPETQQKDEAPVSTEAPATNAAQVVVPSNRRVPPVARRLAESLGVSIDAVVGTGTAGRVLQADVERTARGEAPPLTPAAEPPPPATPAPLPTAAAGDYHAQPMTTTRRTIARRLQASKRDVPHFTLTAQCDLSAMVAARAAAPEKVSLNAWLAAAVAQALRDEPRVNAHLVEDEIRQYDTVNLGVAVATEGGLIVPVLKAAQEQTPAQIAADIASLAEKARTGALAREDISGATFTLSNLGMFGVDGFDAIIDPPQVAILALGRMCDQPVVRDGTVQVAPMIAATLSCDHRVVDGAVGAQFLAALRTRIENP